MVENTLLKMSIESINLPVLHFCRKKLIKHSSISVNYSECLEFPAALNKGNYSLKMVLLKQHLNKKLQCWLLKTAANRQRATSIVVIIFESVL